MTINIKMPDVQELKPRITVFGVGGAGGNAVNNMIESGLKGVDFVVANTDAQALTLSSADRIIQLGMQVTEGLGAGSQPEVGRAAAEEGIDEIRDHLSGAHMVFVTAGMGGGTGTGAAPVVARVAREMGILTVGVVTKPFHFEGQRRLRVADAGIEELMHAVDTLIVIPNQNLFRVATEKTTFADAFAMADRVLYSGVACITDLMVKEGLINLDFADVRAIMRNMGKAMMGTGQSDGEKRAILAAEQAIANPLLDDVSMKGAKGLLISITGGKDMTLYEVDEAATRIREEVDSDANIILGATFDDALEGSVRVSVVATGIEQIAQNQGGSVEYVTQTQKNRPVSTFKPIEQAAPVQTTPVQTAQPVMQKMAAPIASAPQSYAGPSYAAQKAAYEAVAETVVAQPAQVLVQQSVATPTQHVEMSEDTFIPPVAEKVMRPVRMPTMEELPQTVQSQMRAKEGLEDLNVPQPAEKRRMTLLEKLTRVGFGRSEEEPVQEQMAQETMQAPIESVHSSMRPSAPVYSQPQTTQQTFKAPQSGLDAHGRTMMNRPVQEDDSLEIPAFLRRQS